MLQGTYPTLSMTTSMLTVSLRAEYLQTDILGCLGVSRILMDKKLLAGALWILGLLGSIQFAGCVPTQAVYQEQAAQIRLEPGEAASIRVSAAVDEWRDTGVDLVAGADYQLTANGKWRTYGTCNFTGPDGVGLYNTLCPKSPLFPQVLSAYSHSTLVGKVGTGGKPFAIGSSLQLSAEEGGRLFLRTNDMIGGSRDNEGLVDIRIVRSGSAHGGAVVAQTPGIPSGTLGAMKGQSDIPRVALVIGNGDYLQSPLKNPENDAKDMAESLQQLGFDVILELNASQQDMEQAVDYFGRRLIGGRHVALFYFAGHGVQVDGSNYLIPVGAAIRRQSDVRYKAVDLGQILGTMGEAEDNLNIVILDA